MSEPVLVGGVDGNVLSVDGLPISRSLGDIRREHFAAQYTLNGEHVIKLIDALVATLDNDQVKALITRATEVPA